MTHLDGLESLVRAGKLGEARRELREVNLKRIIRKDAVAYANLARRLDLGRISLRILNPIVRPVSGRRSAAAEPATAEEKIEYAASLRSLGAVNEATAILRTIDPGRHPQAAFQLALCLIAEWRYRDAIPLLTAYVRSFKTPSYAMYVGQVNLIQALIHEEDVAEAARLIRDLRREADREKFSLVHWRCVDLSAQLSIVRRDWRQAITHLEEAKRLQDQAKDPFNALLITKWFAIVRSLESGRASPELRDVRQRAIALRHWETVRDCDYYEAKLSGDRDALTRLYFGTPYESFRQRILKSLGPANVLPGSLLWQGGSARKHPPYFDLAKAQSSDGRASLAAGQALHRLLILLTRDFYKPIPSLSIFSELYPDELYHPESSPDRVRQIILRLRRWLRTSDLALELEEIDGGYRLRFTGPAAILLPRDPLPLDHRELELIRLRALIGSEPFTARMAMQALKCSLSAAKLLLRGAVAAGKVRLEGRTRRCLYHWTA